jgi:hypothetical protein
MQNTKRSITANAASDSTDSMKRCRRCSEDKPLDQFHRQARGKFGRASVCRKCSTARSRENRWGSYRTGNYQRTISSIDGISLIFHSSVSHRARNRGLAYELSRDWYRARLEKGICEVTGLPFAIPEHANGGRRTNPYSPSVDRISPHDGYTLSNSRMVILALNMLKADASDKQVRKICHALTTSTK